MAGATVLFVKIQEKRIPVKSIKSYTYMGFSEHTNKYGISIKSTSADFIAAFDNRREAIEMLNKLDRIFDVI